MRVRGRDFRVFALLLGVVLQFSACGKAEYSCSSEEGRRSIVSDVNRYLSDQNCTRALAIIEEYYPQVGCGTDEIRFARASANACAAGLNFFDMLQSLTTENFVGAELWVTLTKLFPSTITDQRVTGGENALDALFAIRMPGTITPSQYVVNASTQNPGSLIAAHRNDDSNIYGMLVAMSLVGSYQNRYGAPDGTYHKTQKLGATAGNANGWEVVTSIDTNACSYAGSVLTMFDSITQVSAILGTSLGGGTGTTLTTAATTYTALLNSACDTGCQACGFPAGACTPCPTELRNRYECTGVATNKSSCAATGVAAFINTNVMGWP